MVGKKFDTTAAGWLAVAVVSRRPAGLRGRAARRRPGAGEDETDAANAVERDMIQQIKQEKRDQEERRVKAFDDMIRSWGAPQPRRRSSWKESASATLSTVNGRFAMKTRTQQAASFVDAEDLTAICGATTSSRRRRAAASSRARRGTFAAIEHTPGSRRRMSRRGRTRHLSPRGVRRVGSRRRQTVAALPSYDRPGLASVMTPAPPPPHAVLGVARGDYGTGDANLACRCSAASSAARGARVGRGSEIPKSPNSGCDPKHTDTDRCNKAWPLGRSAGCCGVPIADNGVRGPGGGRREPSKRGAGVAQIGTQVGRESSPHPSTANFYAACAATAPIEAVYQRARRTAGPRASLMIPSIQRRR